MAFTTTMGEKTYALRPSVVATVIDDGAVLLDLQTKYFYQLNGSAWAIVQLFESDCVTRSSIEEQCRAWGAERLDAVHALLEMLEKDRLVDGGEPGPAAAPDFEGPWAEPRIDRQAQPLQRLVTTAFDPSIPLAE
jgi:hypothetical protein